jgi:hypothetical protein
LKLPKVPFIILINYNDIENIVKYEEKVFELGAHSCLGKNKTFINMMELNEGIIIDEAYRVYFSNRMAHPKAKIYTMEEFDAETRCNCQLQFNF